MHKTILGGLAFALALLAPRLAAQEPARPDQDVQDVLRKVIQRADEQKRADRQRALQILEQAHNFRAAGRIADAIRQAERAQVLFPESAAIRQMLQDLRGEAREAREAGVTLAVARSRLREGAERAEQLVKERQFAQAREMAEAVKTAAGRFPAGSDVAPMVAAAEAVLRDLPGFVTPDGKEVLPPADPVGPPAPLAALELRRRLAKTLSNEWRDEPLGVILRDVATAANVPLSIDPDLERARVFEGRRVYLQAAGRSAEKMLRTVTDLAGTAYLLHDGAVQVLPRTKALQIAAAQGREAADAARRPSPFDARMPGPANVAPAPPPAGAEQLPPAPAAPPEYLASPRAFLDHLDGLLKALKTPEPKEAP